MLKAKRITADEFYAEVEGKLVGTVAFVPAKHIGEIKISTYDRISDHIGRLYREAGISESESGHYRQLPTGKLHGTLYGETLWKVINKKGKPCYVSFTSKRFSAKFGSRAIIYRLEE